MTSAEIHFLLDGRDIRLSNFAPTTTLLTWLREDQARTGTKEGCAEGDCGACTVVVAEARHGQLIWRSVNACIQLLPTLHGKALFTVESLRATSGDLHPAQQAMVDSHGSQCGFCTPGFVMSLFGLYQTEAAPADDAIADALSGNLCRCTGYRPIIDAARRMYHLPAADSSLPSPPWQGAANAAGTALLARLSALDDERMLDLRHPHGRFLAPRTLEAFATAVAAHPTATILAGGTDVGLWITKQLRALPVQIHLGRVRELATTTTTPDWLEIGAAVTLEDAFQAILPHYPELTELCRRFASRPIRNAGTLCGNIANGSPIGDSMPALIALGAAVVLRHGAAVRLLALEDLYHGYQETDLAPGEFVQAVRIPLRGASVGMRTLVRVWKIAKRHDQDISAVCAGFALSMRDDFIVAARLAFGGMAAIPQRARHAEAALTGRRFDAAALTDAQAALPRDFQPLSDMRASADYRMRMAQNLLTRLQLEFAGIPTRVDAVERGHAPT